MVAHCACQSEVATMSIRPPLFRYVCFYMLSMCVAMAVVTLSLTAWAWGPESNDTFWGVAMFVGSFAMQFGLVTAIPSASLGYLAWTAVASRLMSRGETAQYSMGVASIASLWIGIVVMWFLVPALLGDKIFNPLQAVFNPLNLILYPTTAATGWLIGPALFDVQRD